MGRGPRESGEERTLEGSSREDKQRTLWEVDWELPVADSILYGLQPEMMEK